MNAEVRAMKTPAEQALSAAFAAARGTLPGKGAVAAMREGAFRAVRTRGLPHRRVEEWKYTDLRALMREAYPLAPPPDAAAQRARRERWQAAGGRRVPPAGFCRRRFRAGTVRSGAGAGPYHRLDGRRARQRRPAGSRHVGKTFATDDVAVALNTALMGDGAVIRVADGAVTEAADPSCLCDRQRQAELCFRALAGRGGEGRQGDHHREPRKRRAQVNAALELVVGDEAQVDYFKITQARALHVASLLASIGARAQFNSFAFTADSAVVRNQKFHPLCRRRHQGRHSRRHACCGARSTSTPRC